VREIIGLQAAVGELGELYPIAKAYESLHDAAENDLLPRTETLASRLRSLLRHDQLDRRAVDEAAAEISELLDRWRSALEEVRGGTAYRAALDAWQCGDQRALVDLLPRVFAGLRPVSAPERLFRGFSVSSGRRRPGTSPFLSAPAAAERIAEIARDGIQVGGEGEWWDVELAYLELFDDPAAVDDPVTLSYRGRELGAPVFAVAGDHSYRVYGPVLRAPFSISLEEAAEDEWWEASDRPYAEFRDALAEELRARGIEVDVVGT